MFQHTQEWFPTEHYCSLFSFFFGFVINYFNTSSARSEIDESDFTSFGANQPPKSAQHFLGPTTVNQRKTNWRRDQWEVTTGISLPGWRHALKLIYCGKRYAYLSRRKLNQSAELKRLLDNIGRRLQKCIQNTTFFAVQSSAAIIIRNDFSEVHSIRQVFFIFTVAPQLSALCNSMLV